MKMKKILLSCLSLSLMFNLSIAQSDDLIENGSFEDTQGRIKKAGSVSIAVGWSSPTKTNADLYSDLAPANLKVPENQNGREDAYDGSNYVGFSAFSYGNKEPRTYVSTKLKLPMRKGQKYCVKFYVSLAEGSKYACNNIAANFSKKQYNIETDKNIFGESHVVQKHNKVFDALFGWNEVCGTYIAEGGERFLTIGNFSTDGETENIRVKKPADFRGQQTIRAYYYVDYVSVVLIDDEGECECETDVEEEASFVYATSPVNPEGMKPEMVCKYTTVYFGYNESEVSENGEEHLDNIAAVLRANPGKRVRIDVHMDSDEVSDEDAAGVDMKRGEAIAAYLSKQGIGASRMKIEYVKDQAPADESGSEIAHAKNRRVAFTLQ